jgi:hypothetical protein
MISAHTAMIPGPDYKLNMTPDTEDDQQMISMDSIDAGKG